MPSPPTTRQHLAIQSCSSPTSPPPPPFHLHFLVGKSQQMKGRGMAAAGSSNRRQQRHSLTITSAVAASFFCPLGHSKWEGGEKMSALSSSSSQSVADENMRSHGTAAVSMSGPLEERQILHWA